MGQKRLIVAACYTSRWVCLNSNLCATNSVVTHLQGASLQSSSSSVSSPYGSPARSTSPYPGIFWFLFLSTHGDSSFLSILASSVCVLLVRLSVCLSICLHSTGMLF